MAKRQMVLFDFDGTITTRDTLIEFTRFYRGKRKFWIGMLTLTPSLVLYKLKLLANWKAKQFFLSRYFKGEPADAFNARCYAFAKTVLPGLIRPGARRAIEQYKNEQATIAVVTASAENWVKPWCDQQGILCLGTKLEVKDGLLTGKIDGRNCNGDEKVCRVRAAFDLSKFSEIIAYGDSPGDKEMLALAGQQHYKPWRPSTSSGTPSTS